MLSGFLGSLARVCGVSAPHVLCVRSRRSRCKHVYVDSQTTQCRVDVGTENAGTPWFSVDWSGDSLWNAFLRYITPSRTVGVGAPLCLDRSTQASAVDTEIHAMRPKTKTWRLYFCSSMSLSHVVRESTFFHFWSWTQTRGRTMVRFMVKESTESLAAFPFLHRR